AQPVAALPRQPADDEHGAPDDAVHDDLQRRDFLERVPVKRHHAPQHERGNGDPQAAAHIRLRRHASTTFAVRALASVMTTTPARMTAIAPRSCAVNRSPASNAPNSTAIGGLM